VTISSAQQDQRLPAKLSLEAEGILAWMVRGCMEWQEEGLNEPEKVRHATAVYREEMDLIGGFIDACCLRGPDLRVGSTELWASYQRWADREGMASRDRITSLTQFGTLLSQKGNGAKKTGGTKVRQGLALKPTSGSQAGDKGPRSEESSSGQ
jgi:putative DNA primase/helicase